MKKKLLIGTLSAVMSAGILAGCNTNSNNMYDPEGVNYRPVRYNERIDNDLDRRNGTFEQRYRENRNDTINDRNRRVNDLSPVRDERTRRTRDRNLQLDPVDDINRGFLNVDENDMTNRILNNNEDIRNRDVNLRRNRGF